ncbi:MAG: hypothetical protein ACLUDU_22105 [Butyricimonas faecihominis]
MFFHYRAIACWRLAADSAGVIALMDIPSLTDVPTPSTTMRSPMFSPEVTT